MSELTSEHLHDSFWKGEFADLVLIADVDSDCFNAAKLCQLKGKNISHWMALLGTDELIEEVCSMLKIPAYVVDDDGKTIMNPKIRYVIKGGSHRETWGTYLHIRFLVPLAQWICVKYGSHVTTVMLEIKAKDNVRKQAMMGAKITKQRVKISTLNDKVQTLIDEGRAARKLGKQQLQEARLDAAKKDKQLKTLMARAGMILDQNDHLVKKVDTVQQELKITKHRKTVPTKHGRDDNQLTILLNGYPDEDLDLNWWGNYSVIRANAANTPARIREIREKFPDAIILLQIEYTPNGVMLWKNIMAKIGGKITIHHSEFDLNDDYTVEELIRDIKQAHAVRLK
jgi:hypothetical protein